MAPKPLGSPGLHIMLTYMNMIPFLWLSVVEIYITWFFFKYFIPHFSTRGVSIHRINELFPLKPPLVWILILDYCFIINEIPQYSYLVLNFFLCCMYAYKRQLVIWDTGLIKVNLEFSFSIQGLFQTWSSNKPGFENLNSRSAPGFEKLHSRSELELSKLAMIKWEKSSNPGFDCWVW